MTTVAGAVAVEVRPLDPKALTFAADLHRRALPAGLFPRLGRRFLRCYYRSFLSSPHAVALAVCREGLPVGVLVGTVANARHYRWVLRHHGWRLALAGVLALLVRPRTASWFLRTRTGRYAAAVLRLARRGRGPRQAPGAARPEQVAVLTHVAVAEGARGHGCGRRLVEAFVALARAAGADEAQLVTDGDSEANRAFYTRCGWRHTGDRADHDGRPIAAFALPLR